MDVINLPVSVRIEFLINFAVKKKVVMDVLTLNVS